MLEALGCVRIDADLVARELMQPELPAWRAVVDRFGPSILLPDGRINRAALGAIVFADAAALLDLDRAVHPFVNARLDAMLAALPSETVAAIEAIKLIEAGFASHVDSLWLVVAPDEVAIARLVRGRGMIPAEAARRLAAQPAVESKRAIADVVIDNGGSVEATNRQVAAAFARLLQVWSLSTGERVSGT